MRKAFMAGLAALSVSAGVVVTQLPAAASNSSYAYCSNGTTTVTGVGSTLDANAIQGSFDPALHGGSTAGPACPGETVTPSAGGSGKGQKQVLYRAGTGAASGSAPLGFSDFAPNLADWAAMTDASGTFSGDLSASNTSPNVITSPTQASPIETIPVVVASVAVVYRLDCWGANTLDLTSPVIAKIYDGAITRWNDPTIVLDNPGIDTACGSLPITLTARSDVSGTTYIFKDYLSKRNPEYAALEQAPLNTTWPASLKDTNSNLPSVNQIACRGNGTGAEVACVSGINGAIGYAGFSNAAISGVHFASVDNPLGTFTPPTPTLCTAAAGTAVTPQSVLGNWSTVSFTDSVVGYPICGFSYAITYLNQKTAMGSAYNAAQSGTTVDFLEAALSTQGQAALNGPVNPTTKAGGYDSLPSNVVAIAQQGVDAITAS